MEQTTQFDTKPLLRPDQVTRAKDEIKSLEAKLSNKHIEDKAEVQRQLRRAKQTFETQVPRPPEPGEEGKMVSRAKELLEQILPGMCSQEEMRKAPPGAVDNHMAWEKRNKTRIAEWKHIMLRLTAGSNDTDAANLERHRPRQSTLSMDNAFIPGKQIFLPNVDAGRGVTFSNEQLALLDMLSPEIRSQLASLDNATRAKVKEAVEGIGLEPDPVQSAAGKLGAEKRLAHGNSMTGGKGHHAGKRKRKPWTDEQKAALVKRLADARAAKAAKQAA